MRITPRVHEVRAARKRLRFRGRSNLVEPDEVSGGPQATNRFAVLIIQEFSYNSMSCKIIFLNSIEQDGSSERRRNPRSAPKGRDERESSCCTMGARAT